MATTIESSDPYITITDNSGYFGSLAVDSTKENTGDPYTISASASAPQGHPALFRLIAVDGWWSDTLEFTMIIGRIHYYIWNPDPTPTPGEYMHTALASVGYSGNYGLSLPVSDLDVYSAIFVCVGIYSNNYVLGATDPEVTALVDYVNSGGRMYLEGGDVWYYDPLYGGYDFGPLFGINATSDGTSDGGPYAGQASTFTVGMNFSYTGENNWMDHISPTGTGFLIFRDSNNSYDCGVANDAGTYRTVGCGFELGALTDASPPSTRAALLDSIMRFFGVNLVGVEENTQTSAGILSLQPYPNPFRDRVDIQYTLPSNVTQVQFKIFDAAGRLVKDLGQQHVHSTALNNILWNGRDLNGKKVANGIYFVHMKTDNEQLVEKIILIE